MAEHGGRWRRAWLAVAALMTGWPMACSPGNVYHEPPPPEVVVARPVRRSVTSYLERTGTVQPSERVELRARVKGFLKERKFHDGADVQAGQLLFVIDEEPFQVRLEQAKAKQAEAEAALRKAERSKDREVARAQLELDTSQLALAKVEENRARNLVARMAGSREELDRAEAGRKKAEAQVESDRAHLEQIETDHETNILAARSALAAARADVRNAEIDLGYCRITSPIDGRITAREIDVGNYVGEGMSTVLATVLKSNPIYAYVSVSEDDMVHLRALAGNSGQVPMEMGLGGDEGYPHRGRVDYTDPSVDPSTGTLRVRGLFANPRTAITPGMFARVRIPVSIDGDALLVPDRALGSDQAGTFLLVVGAEDKVERRVIRSGVEDRGMRVVSGQVSPSDRVVVDGLLRARPGMKVSPKLDDNAAQAMASTNPSPGRQD